VAILYSYDQIWALQVQPQTKGFSFGVWLARYHEALQRLGVGVDVVGTHADLSPYRLVICPPLYLLEDALAARLERYVAHGGHLVASARTGVKDERNIARTEPLPGPLARVLGIEVEEYDAIGDGTNTIELWDGSRFHVSTWCDVVREQGAHEIAEYLGDFYARRPAITSHAYGEGRAWYVGTLAEERFFRHFLRAVVAEIGLRSVGELPKGVGVAARDGERGRVLVMTNLTGQEQHVTLADPCEDLFARTLVTNTIALEPYGVRVLRTTR